MIFNFSDTIYEGEEIISMTRQAEITPWNADREPATLTLEERFIVGAA
jgi:hypothetical protein